VLPAGPQFKIGYNQPFYVALDHADVVAMAFDFDDPMFSLPAAFLAKLRALQNLAFVLPTRGSYRIGFRYGYAGCQNPLTAPITTKNFTY
jgi:hypothetical protein